MHFSVSSSSKTPYLLAQSATDIASAERDKYNAQVLYEMIPNTNDAFSTDDGTVRIINNGESYQIQIKQDPKPMLFRQLNKKGVIGFHGSEANSQRRAVTLVVDDAINRVYRTYSDAQRRAVQKNKVYDL